ncbi:hypothetical protein VTI74DRAFT_9201 [Chaetomium olivicolor]
MSGLHSRRGQHRRQNSTPSATAAYEPVKIAPLPSFQQRPPVSHRRGLSLDTRRQQFASATTHSASQQDYTTVGGLPTSVQHRTPEAQNQRAVRPGSALSNYSEHDEDNFLISPQVTPQSRRFANVMAAQGAMTDVNSLQLDAYLGSYDMTKSPNFSNGNAIDPSRDFDFFVPDSTLSTPTFLTFPDSSPAHGWNSENETAGTQSRRASRRISNGIMDKVAKFEALGSGLDGSSRPCTPSDQDAIASFSQSPVQTPVKLEQATLRPPNRFAGDYDESMEETLKPIRKRNSGIFQEMRQQAEAMVQTPPRANTIPMALTEQALRTPEFMNMRNISAEFKKIERAFENIPSEPLQMPATVSPLKQVGGGQNPFDNKPQFQMHPAYHPEDTITPLGRQSPTRSRRSSPHRRTESIASITSAASIADINIEETKTETGVTLEDIAAFIQGPDPTDGKWLCLYENCNKRFGRKENIKSHVQTHLNDRQYQCPTCQKCFVRQHDLKRHAKIHTGIKPYPCECGNSFARHDALTRHRQRGMCIGAFDGIVRKVVKRGRPKKIRGPDMEERRDKADRTRRKNASRPSTANGTSPPSSHSGYSDSSAAPSPINEFDGLLDDDQFPGILDMAIPSLPPSTTTPSSLNPTTLGMSAAPIPTLPPTISGSMAEVFRALSPMPPHHAPSPSAMSSYSHASHLSNTTTNSRPTTSTIATTNPTTTTLEVPQSPGAKSTSSHYTTTTTSHLHLPNTPPGLSSTSSPPPTSSSARFFDLDPSNPSDANNNDSCGLADPDLAEPDPDSSAISIGLGTTVAAHTAAAMGSGIMEEEMMMQFHHVIAAGEEGHHHDHHHMGIGVMGMLGGNGVAGKFGGSGGMDAGGGGYDPVSMFTHAGGEEVFFGTS